MLPVPDSLREGADARDVELERGGGRGERGREKKTGGQGGEAGSGVGASGGGSVWGDMSLGEMFPPIEGSLHTQDQGSPRGPGDVPVRKSLPNATFQQESHANPIADNNHNSDSNLHPYGENETEIANDIMEHSHDLSVSKGDDEDSSDDEAEWRCTVCGLNQEEGDQLCRDTGAGSMGDLFLCDGNCGGSFHPQVSKASVCLSTISVYV